MKSLFALLCLLPSLSWSQIDEDPRWKRYQEGRSLESVYTSAGGFNVSWSPDGLAYGLMVNRDRKWFSVKTGEPVGPPPAIQPEVQLVSRGGRPIDSPNGEYRISAGRTLALETLASKETRLHQETDQANPNIRAGSVPWVYAEELEQQSAMGWASSGNKFWFTRFDRTPVPNYYLAGGQSGLQSTLMQLDYPKAGTANHLVELWIGDAVAGTFTKVDQAPTKELEYLFDIRWISPGHLMYMRMDRLQKKREIALYDVAAQQTKLLHVEHSSEGFTPYQWRPRVIGDWLYVATDLNGFANWSRVGWKTGKREDLTNHAFDVEFNGLDFVDSNQMVYRARGGQNPLATQLYRYDFRTKKSTLLTNPDLHHRVQVSPNGQTFLDVPQMPGIAPEPALYSLGGGKATLLRKLDPAPVPLLPTPPVEVIAFTSADTRTLLTATLHFPRGFDATQKYPVLFDVYGGPEQSDVSLRFRPYAALTELGFLVAHVETRGGLHRGSAFRNASYQKLGIVEIDDFAAFAKVLQARSYADRTRFGMFGTSYGGYASLMALLRYPEIWSAASASCPVTDWRNYDTIYTERYMGLPQDQKASYDAGNAVLYAKSLKGKLQLYFGTADDNVHPSNSLQLIRALEGLRKEFDTRVGPDRGHSYVGDLEMVRFFWDAFKMR